MNLICSYNLIFTFEICKHLLVPSKTLLIYYNLNVNQFGSQIRPNKIWGQICIQIVFKDLSVVFPGQV